MNTQQYLEQLWNNHWLDNLFQEMYWEGGWSSVTFEQCIVNKAKQDNITLKDLEDYDFDQWYYDYKSTEKLS